MKFYVKKMVEMVAIFKNGGHFEIYVVNGIFHKNDPRGTISQILVLPDLKDFFAYLLYYWYNMQNRKYTS